MAIKLGFDPKAEFPKPRVWTEDSSQAAVAGMLESEWGSVEEARGFAQRMKDVVAKRTPEFQGVGNGYFFMVSPLESEVGLAFGENQETVAVATADLIAAVEAWAAHLEATRGHR